MLPVTLFLIELIHWGAIVFTRLKQMTEAFAIVFLHPSPVLLFFSLMEAAGVGYSGEVSKILLASLLFNIVKYAVLIRSLMVYGFTFLNVISVAAEIGYLGVSSVYLVYYSYL